MCKNINVKPSLFDANYQQNSFDVMLKTSVFC